jgi:hypothetical protein
MLERLVKNQKSFIIALQAQKNPPFIKQTSVVVGIQAERLIVAVQRLLFSMERSQG